MTTEVSTVISTPMPVVTKTTDTVVPDADVIVDPLVRQLNTMAELLETLAKTSKSLTVEMKSLTKDVNKLRVSKLGTKKTKRVVDKDTPRKPSALEKPVPISDELADFLGLTKGELYSRQVVTQNINKYVKDNDLQNPENRRYILLDSEAGQKLKTLLRDPDQPLTFFNIQRYLKDHYIKVDTPVTDTVTDTVTSTKSVDVSETKKDEVVADADKVAEDDTVTDVPKKKVIRKVVKKSST